MMSTLSEWLDAFEEGRPVGKGTQVGEFTPEMKLEASRMPDSWRHAKPFGPSEPDKDRRRD